MTDPGPVAGKTYYTVFVSATYVDLKDERQAVMSYLLSMDAIPTGMELFGASSRPSWEVITSTIDICDYYVLIIGGRYGSRVPTDLRGQLGNVSYTEAEFDYATALRLPMLVFVQSNPTRLSRTKSDIAALRKFQDRATKRVNRTTFTSPDSLTSQVGIAWPRLLRDSPRPGWVRQAAATTPSPPVRHSAAPLPQSIREVDIAFDNWFNLRDQEVKLQCELTASSDVIDKKTGVEIDSGNILGTTVTMRWGDLFFAVADALGRDRVRGLPAVVVNIGAEILAKRSDLFDASFLASMAAAERAVQRQAAPHDADTVSPSADDVDAVKIRWTAALDERSQERVGITLRGQGLLNEDYDIWYLSEGGKQLHEQYKLNPPGSDVFANDRPS